MRPALFFDLDGTLNNSAQDILNSVLHAFARHGLARPDLERLRPLIGRPLSEMFGVCDVAPDQHEALSSAYREHYLEHCADTTVPYPGVLEVLIELREKGYLLAVATAKRGFVAQAVCDKVGLTPHLDHVQGVENFPPKPAPDVIYAALTALERAHGPVAGLWMVGDTSSDIFAGKAAGLRTFGVTWGTHGRETLETAGADSVGDTLEDFLKVLEAVRV